jgi:hypothetical protein
MPTQLKVYAIWPGATWPHAPGAQRWRKNVGYVGYRFSIANNANNPTARGSMLLA